LAVPVYGRLDETIQEIEARYGKPLKGVTPESPATIAGLYQKNGFQITVGFYEGKAYYEQYQKIDPQKPNSFLRISYAEQETLLKANCKGCNWTGNHTEIIDADSGVKNSDTAYDRSDGLAKALYRDNTGILRIRSVKFEKQKEADDKERQQKNLKGF
jgi:hypothetical protein